MTWKPTRIVIDLLENKDKTRTTITVKQYKLWFIKTGEFSYEGPDYNKAIDEALKILDVWGGK